MKEVSKTATILAFDYGVKNIGVAIGNLLLKQATPLTIIKNHHRLYRFNEIEKLIKKWLPEQLIVGLPLYLDGTPYELTQRAKRFGNQLHGRFNLPIIWVDERYSSVAAAQVLGKKHTEKLDAQAAAIILQQYFDEKI